MVGRGGTLSRLAMSQVHGGKVGAGISGARGNMFSSIYEMTTQNTDDQSLRWVK